MRTFGKIGFALALAIGGPNLMPAQTSSDWSEQWHRTKFGRSSPTEEARIKAERASTAHREVAPPVVARPTNDWFREQWYKTKFGRNSPAEQRRLDAEQATTAFREETHAGAPTNNTWLSEQRYKTKYGRSSPAEELRTKSKGR